MTRFRPLSSNNKTGPTKLSLLLLNLFFELLLIDKCLKLLCKFLELLLFLTALSPHLERRRGVRREGGRWLRLDGGGVGSGVRCEERARVRGRAQLGKAQLS